MIIKASKREDVAVSHECPRPGETRHIEMVWIADHLLDPNGETLMMVNEYKIMIIIIEFKSESHLVSDHFVNLHCLALRLFCGR